MNYLLELDNITKLKVKNSRVAITAWYEKYYDENSKEWFQRNQKDNLEYDFVITDRECLIRIYLAYWAWTELLKCSGKTTEEACKKAITKFNNQYSKLK